MLKENCRGHSQFSGRSKSGYTKAPFLERIEEGGYFLEEEEVGKKFRFGYFTYIHDAFENTEVEMLSRQL